jgi:hypothetical protein
MMLSDSFKGQLREKLKTVASDLLNTDLVIIPGGMTSQLQVLHMVVKKPFKDSLYCLNAICRMIRMEQRMMYCGKSRRLPFY